MTNKSTQTLKWTRGKRGALLIFIMIFSFGTFLAVFQVFLVHGRNGYFYLGDNVSGLNKGDSNVILWWNSFGSQDETKVCGDARCYFTHDRIYTSKENLKAILFYGSDFRIEDLPPRRLKQVKWGLLHEESPRNNPIFVHEEALNLFNYSSTFSRMSDIPLTLSHLIGLHDLSGLTYFVSTKEKDKLIAKENYAPLLYIQSDCNTASNRDAYVSELMKYIKIDSYGACLQNANLEDRLRIDYLSKLTTDEFLSFVAGYKFTIAFENAVCEDYVTEKLWRPLVVGSVPIYYGSPTFQDWLPNDRSAISILDFSGPKALAEYLHTLLHNNTEYERYLSHKLSQASHRISNSLLLDELKKKPYEDFGEYLEKFECFVCQTVVKAPLEEMRIVTKEHYNCPLPRNPITGLIDRKNFWVEQWILEGCTAKLLKFYASNNRTFDIIQIEERKLEHYIANRCLAP